MIVYELKIYCVSQESNVNLNNSLDGSIESVQSYDKIAAVDMGTAELELVSLKALNWLINSGIQIRSEDHSKSGGFSAWYEMDTDVYPFIYSEITGYMLTMMCWEYSKTGNIKYLESAIHAGNWLINTTHEPNGGFHCIHPLIDERNEFKKNQQYSFDNGIILNGLVNLYRHTREERWLASAVTVADWLINFAQRPNGAFFPVYQMDEDRFFESDKEWSLCSGSYHGKIAIGLLNLYDLTKKQKYLSSAQKVCDFALGCQNSSGRFISFLTRGGTNAHPHNYSCEALWVAGKYLGREDYLVSAARGVEWILNLQDSQGIVPRLYKDDTPIYNERVDAISQTLRMAVLSLQEGLLPKKYLSNIEKLVSILPSYQVLSNNKKTNGAFVFGKLSNGKPMPHANVWVTSFAVQALELYTDQVKGNKQSLMDPFYMV